MISGRILSTVFIVFLCYPAMAQRDCRGILYGEVRDESGAKIIGAAVGIPERAQGTTTDNLGMFRLGTICKGTTTISVHSLWYQDYQLRMTFNNDSTRVVIVLKQTAEQLKEVVVQDHANATDHAQNYAI